MNKGNQRIASLALLLAVFALPVPVSAAATVSITDAEIAPDESVTILIMIKEVTELGVADINLTYDQSVVNVLDVTNSDFDTLFPPNINNSTGITRIGAFQMVDPGLNGTVTLAEVTLKAVGDIGECSTLNLGINELKTVGPPGADIPATVVDGTFCIVTTTTSTTTTTTSTTTTSSTTTSTTTTTTIPTTTTTTTVRSRSSSGGGGGGGGGAPTSFVVWINNVSAGQTFVLEINDKDIPYINGLSLTAKQDIYTSRLSITDLDKKPYYSMTEPDATVYRYFKVSYDKDNYVESASFKFSINKSWLKDNDIDPYKFSLYRYTNSWEELDTKILDEDDENIYLEVTTPGFSYFSLGGIGGSGYKSLVKEEVVSPTPVEEETIEPQKVETPTSAPPVETPELVKAPEVPSEEEKGGICGPTVVVLLAMVILLFRNRRMLP